MFILKRLPIVIIVTILICIFMLGLNIYFQINILMSAAYFFGITSLVIGLFISIIAAFLLVFSRFEKYWISGYPLLLFCGILAAAIHEIPTYSIINTVVIAAFIFIGYIAAKFTKNIVLRFVPIVSLVIFFGIDKLPFFERGILVATVLFIFAGLLGTLILHNLRLHKSKLWIW
jgi:hypothetical protein